MGRSIPILAVLLTAACDPVPAQGGRDAGSAAVAPAPMAPSNGVGPHSHGGAPGGTGMQSTGDPDRDFATMMIPHHQGAIEMARAELRAGKDPEMRALAEKIIADQEREIGQLRRWLERSAPEAR